MYHNASVLMEAMGIVQMIEGMYKRKYKAVFVVVIRDSVPSGRSCIVLHVSNIREKHSL